MTVSPDVTHALEAIAIVVAIFILGSALLRLFARRLLWWGVFRGVRYGAAWVGRRRAARVALRGADTLTGRGGRGRLPVRDDPASVAPRWSRRSRKWPGR